MFFIKQELRSFENYILKSNENWALKLSMKNKFFEIERVIEWVVNWVGYWVSDKFNGLLLSEWLIERLLKSSTYIVDNSAILRKDRTTKVTLLSEANLRS